MYQLGRQRCALAAGFAKVHCVRHREPVKLRAALDLYIEQVILVLYIVQVEHYHESCEFF